MSRCIRCPARCASGVFGALQRLGAETSAQTTVEAAFLLPTFLTLLLLALQPVCLLYTRAVMESAASETARLMVTSESASDESLEAFAQRRLVAVPNVSIFHQGGPLAWDIDFSKAADTGGDVSVEIKGTVKPLPVIGAFASFAGRTTDSGDVELAVNVSYKGRPSWLKGLYDSWVSGWN